MVQLPSPGRLGGDKQPDWLLEAASPITQCFPPGSALHVSLIPSLLGPWAALGAVNTHPSAASCSRANKGVFQRNSEWGDAKPETLRRMLQVGL